MNMTSRELEITEDFNKISSTALLCAKIKAEYTNLPYAADIYRLAVRDTEKFNGIIDSSFLEHAVQIPSFRGKLSVLEGRHIAINDAINTLTNCPVLELSAGLSSRFLELSGRNFYAETDLQEMVLLKKRIVRQILGEKSDESSHRYILPLNPMDLPELFSFGENFIKEFNENPLAIINEGLLMYLSTKEQEQLRDNLGLFLDKYSPEGYWITTDFSSRPIEKENDAVNFVMKRIEKETGRAFNRFQNEEQVNRFLSEGSLKGKPLPNHHLLNKLSCLKKAGITREEAVGVADLYKVWKITLK